MADNNREINIARIRLSKGWVILFIFLALVSFVYYESILYQRLLAQLNFSKAKTSFVKARYISKELIVKKSLLYQDGLKLLKSSLLLDPADSRFNFEFAEIINEAKDDPELWGSLGINNLVSPEEAGLGPWELARIRYGEAILKEPTNAIYHQRLGSLYDKIGQTRKAEEEFTQAVILDPQNISLRLYLSQYFLSKGKQDDFLKHISRAVDIDKAANLTTSWEMQNFLKRLGREDLIKQ
jgi:tetratricopeptide (TPR) repeat protein